MNNIVGTGLDTKSAADTLSRVNLGNLLFGIDGDCVSRTNLHTVAVAEAGEGAESVSRIDHIRADTGGNSLVIVFSFIG